MLPLFFGFWVMEAHSDGCVVRVLRNGRAGRACKFFPYTQPSRKPPYVRLATDPPLPPRNSGYIPPRSTIFHSEAKVLPSRWQQIGS